MDAEFERNFRIEKEPLNEEEKVKALRLCAKILAEMFVGEKMEEMRQQEKLQSPEEPDKEDVPQILPPNFSDLKGAV